MTTVELDGDSPGQEPGQVTDSDPLLELRAITKKFGPLVANNAVSGVVRVLGTVGPTVEDHRRAERAEDSGRLGLHRTDHLPGRQHPRGGRPGDDLRPDQQHQLSGEGCRGTLPKS
jgi:hypothetical protein